MILVSPFERIYMKRTQSALTFQCQLVIYIQHIFSHPRVSGLSRALGGCGCVCY